MLTCLIKCVFVWFFIMSCWALSRLIRNYVKHKTEGAFS